MRPTTNKTALLATLKRAAVAVLFGFTGTVASWGCGINWNLPASPMSADGEYRFQYWEELGRVKVASSAGKEALQVPLHLGFTPASTYTSPLGYGFEFALFDSRLIWVDAKHVKLYLPDGNVESLTFDKGKNTLRGSGWLGELRGANNQVTLKASCNWVLNFSGNRLASLRTPDGVTLTISRASNGTLQLNRGGIPLVTLTPDLDKQSIQKFYRLKFADKTAILKMGQRPVVVRDKGKPEKIVMAPALVGVKFDNEKERGFYFRQDEMNIAGCMHRWNHLSRLLNAGDESFSVESIEGVRCLKRTRAGGVFSLNGFDSGKRRSVLKDFFSKDTTITDYMSFNKGGITDYPKNLRRINGNGDVISKEQFWYDEGGKVIRLAIENDEGSFLFLKNTDSVEKIDKTTGKRLLKIVYDKNRNPISVQKDKISLSFKYNEFNADVTLNEEGGVPVVKRFSHEEVSHLLPELSNPIFLFNPNQKTK